MIDYERFFLDSSEEHEERKYLILIIYDVVENKRRGKLAKFLEEYGFRVQKSAFEAMLTKKNYQRLLKEISFFIAKEDNLRIYKIKGRSEVVAYGQGDIPEEEDFIII